VHRFLKTATGRVVVAVGGTALLLIGFALFITLRSPHVPRLQMEGIAENPCVPAQVFAVPVGTEGSYYPGSNVLRVRGRLYTVPGRTKAPTGAESSCLATAVKADQRWLGSGLVPGTDGQQRTMATRALLDLRLLVRPDGAVIAGWSPEWEYAWPRDSSWVAVALADTGHPAEAFRILSFLQHVQPRSGIWAARYLPDGAGPVRDGRPAELDADGWVPWAVWSWSVAAGGTGDRQTRQELTRLWPMVVAAADATARSLAKDGLPVPAMDYWEDSVQVTLGTAAPLLAGLRAAADIAVQLGDGTKARLWAEAAARLSAGISAAFGSYGFPRVPFSHSGVDASVAFLGPPFADPDASVRRAAAVAQRLLDEPNGGLRPGTNWPGAPGVAWTAESAFFALFDAGTGQRSLSAALLSWLAAHETSLGELPEQVNAAGRAISVAPLAWTDAVILLTLVEQTRPLPSIPVTSLPPANSDEA
jgi:glucoamylase